MVVKTKGTIVEIRNLTKDVKHFTIECDEPLNFKAGQFVNLSFKEGEELLRKPYSIASVDTHSDKIELCIKLVEGGKLTPVLFEKEVGFEVEIMGALGLFTLENLEKDKVVFIATGTGIAPFRPMLDEVLELQKEVTHQKRHKDK